MLTIRSYRVMSVLLSTWVRLCIIVTSAVRLKSHRYWQLFLTFEDIETTVFYLPSPPFINCHNLFNLLTSDFIN